MDGSANRRAFELHNGYAVMLVGWVLCGFSLCLGALLVIEIPCVSSTGDSEGALYQIVLLQPTKHAPVF